MHGSHVKMFWSKFSSKSSLTIVKPRTNHATLHPRASVRTALNSDGQEQRRHVPSG